MNCKRHNLCDFRDDTLCSRCAGEAIEFATGRLIANHSEEYKLIWAEEIERLGEEANHED